jgi:hypothetical protein
MYPELPDWLCVKEDPIKGRGLYAKQRIKKGTTLVKATPAVSLLDLNNLPLYCSQCGQETALKHCTGCRAVSYCSVSCQRAAWAEVHKLECPALKRFSTTYKPDRPGMKVAVPETPVRALAHLLWKKSLRDAAWWEPIALLQSRWCFSMSLVSVSLLALRRRGDIAARPTRTICSTSFQPGTAH